LHARANASINVTTATAPPRMPSHHRAPDFVPRRQPRKLRLDEVEIVLKRGEVVAGPIDLAQRERALVRH
jgi:hypothetical protein